MNRKLWLLLLICSACTPLLLYGEIPDWVKNISAKHSFPETDAETVKLWDESSIEIMESPLRIVEINRVAFLSLKNDLTISKLLMKSKKIDVKSFDAWLVDERGSRKKVDKEYKLESQSRGSEFYSATKAVTFSVPNVTKGSVVAFESKIEEVLDYPAYMVTFTREQPTENICVKLALPLGWSSKAIIKNGSGITEETSGAATCRWTAHHIDKIPDINYLPESQWLDIQIGLLFYKPDTLPVLTWESIAKSLDTLYVRNEVVSTSIDIKLKELTQNLTTPLEKIKKIAGYVQKDIRYVFIDLGNNAYVPHKAGDIYANLYGDCKDKATLLITMLGGIGIKAYPVICTSRTDRMVDENFPSIEQFNHAITAIELPPDCEDMDAAGMINGKKMLFFDPTNSDCPFGLLSYQLQGSKALFISKDSKGLINLPESSYIQNTRAFYGQFILKDNGDIEGSIKRNYYAAARYQITSDFISQTPEKFRSEHIESLHQFINPTVEGFKANNQEGVTEPFIIEYKIKATQYAQKAADMLALKPVMFMKWNENPFVEDDRKEPIAFPYVYNEILRYSFQLPPGYVLADKPVSIELKNPYAEYSLSITAEDGGLLVNRTFSIKKAMIEASSYKEFKNFFHEMFKIDNRVIYVRAGSRP